MNTVEILVSCKSGVLYSRVCYALLVLLVCYRLRYIVVTVLGKL